MLLRVLSWNIWIEGYFDQIADFLEASGADIIGLQEVQADDPERDVIGYLSKLGYQRAFAPVMKTWGGKTWNDGPAIFTKYEIRTREIYLLSKLNGRAAVGVDIQVGDVILHAFSVHRCTRISKNQRSKTNR